MKISASSPYKYDIIVSLMLLNYLKIPFHLLLVCCSKLYHSYRDLNDFYKLSRCFEILTFFLSICVSLFDLKF